MFRKDKRETQTEVVWLQAAEGLFGTVRENSIEM
jgi:hypothetical protein